MAGVGLEPDDRGWLDNVRRRETSAFPHNAYSSGKMFHFTKLSQFDMAFFNNLKPRSWLTKEYWELHITRDGWSNEDVDVVPKDKRTWRSIDFLWLWLSDGGNVGTMQQAGSIIALGLSWREAAVAM